MNALTWRRTQGDLQGLPHNLEAEQAVLGALMFDNESALSLDALEPGHFFEPLHAAVFELSMAHVRAGRLADPVTLQGSLDGRQAFAELGGLGYLMDLVDRAPPLKAVGDYAAQVIEAHQRRELIRLARDVIYTVKSQPETPIGEVLAEVGATALALQAGAKELQTVTAEAAVARVVEEAERPPETKGGVQTGLPSLDRLVAPLLPGDLVLLMGRPSMGKSAAAECIALNMAAPELAEVDAARVGVVQINGEMSIEQMARRHAADLCFHRWGDRGPKYSDVRKGEITAAHLDMLRWARDRLAGVPLVMLKRTGLKVGNLRTIARRQASEWARVGVPLGALIVDHVGLLRPDERTRDRYEAQTLISNAMKELADELHCVVIALNQMNRDCERRDDKRPQLADLRDSGSWEQDADFVIGFYREAYYAQRETEPKGGERTDEWNDWHRRRGSSRIEAIVLKAREGECGTADLWGDVARNAIRGGAPEGGLL